MRFSTGQECHADIGRLSSSCVSKIPIAPHQFVHITTPPDNLERIYAGISTRPIRNMFKCICIV
eukprot:753399-Hanusia_phi.AAC.2